MSMFGQPSWRFSPDKQERNIGAGYSDSDDEDDSDAQNGGLTSELANAPSQLAVSPGALVSLLGGSYAGDQDHTGDGSQGHLHDLSMTPLGNARSSMFGSGFSDEGDAHNDPELRRAYPGPGTNNMQKGKMKLSARSDSEDSAEDTEIKELRQSLFGRIGRGGTSEKGDDGTGNNVSAGGPVMSGESDEEMIDGFEAAVEDSDAEETEDREDPRKRRFSFNLGFPDKNGSNRGSPALSEGDSVLGSDLRPQAAQKANYELRRNIDRQGKTTWLDVDNTGNYDPEEEAQKSRKQKPKRKNKNKKAPEPKVKIKKLIVKLRFRHHSMGTIANIMDDEFNWPDGWSVLDSEDEAERIAKLSLYRQNTPGIEIQQPISDPYLGSEIDDLTGHPAARGCIACRQHGYDCSIVKSGGTWPCRSCEDGETECVLIIPPTKKGKCEHCQSLGDDVECSFEDPLGGDAGAICDQCIEDGLTECHAKPREGYTHRIADLDEMAYGPNRPWTQCTLCRLHKKRCSLKRKTDRPPCRECKKTKTGCTFLNLTKQPEDPTPSAKGKGKGKAKAKAVHFDNSADNGEGPSAPKRNTLFSEEDLAWLKEHEEVAALIRETTPDVMMEDAEGHKGRVTKVKTCFAHPIQFNIDARSPHACSFCSEPQFAMFGHFVKEAHVIEWLDGKGMTEIGGGHTEHFDLTTMCEECTMGRAQIICCPKHTIQPLEEHEIVLSEEKPIEALMRSDPGSLEMKRQLSRWCSVCFTQAKFICRTKQPSVMAELGSEQVMMPGCGLRLCKYCKEGLEAEHENNFQSLVRSVDRLEKSEKTRLRYGFGRADTGLLKADGLLGRSVGITAWDGDEDEGNGGEAMDVDMDAGLWET